MLHHLAGATIQVANLFNYNCHPQENGNKMAKKLPSSGWQNEDGKKMAKKNLLPPLIFAI